jgi:tetratricopeptide (TPR) repeat protein
MVGIDEGRGTIIMGSVRWLFVLLLTTASVARATEDAAARRAKTLFVEGQKQYDLGEWDAALQAFRAAYLEKPDPSFLYNLGQCLRKLGRVEEEAEVYRSYLRRLPDAPNRATVEQFIREAEDQIAHCKKSPPPETLPPGERRFAPATAAATVAAPPQPVNATSRSPLYRRWWLWTAIGGAVAVGVGVGLGVGLAPPSDAMIPSSTAGTQSVNFP